MAKKLITLTVDRSRWLNGHVVAATDQTKPDPFTLRSRLHDTRSGLMCCLGFGVRQAGLTPENIGSCGLPSDLGGTTEVKDVDLMSRLITIEDSATETNDEDPDVMTPKQREADLRATFKRVGIRLCFTGDAAPAIRKARRLYGKAAK